MNESVRVTSTRRSQAAHRAFRSRVVMREPLDYEACPFKLVAATLIWVVRRGLCYGLGMDAWTLMRGAVSAALHEL